MTGLLLIGPLPKSTATGVSLGFRSLVKGLSDNGVAFNVVDLQSAGEPVSSGVFSVRRARQIIVPILSAIRLTPRARTVYLTIACSKAGFLKDFMIIWWAWILRKRIVLHLKSGGYYEFYREAGSLWKTVIRSTLNRADKIIALGESIRSQFSFVHNYESTVEVVPNGPPHDIQSADAARELVTPFRIIYLSNMIPSKGFMDVLLACKLICERETISGFECHFCGAFNLTNEESAQPLPTSPEEFQRCINELDLQNQVFYHGTVYGDKKEKLLQQSSVFVLPTQYRTEGQPISIIEAMAYGLPVIATPWKGIVEQVIDGKTGVYVPFRDPARIAAAIERMATNKAFYAELSRGALAHYHENFTREVHISRMTSLLLNACDN